MSRLKGSKNSSANSRPFASTLSPEERIRFLANIIVDKILEDQKNGQVILHSINKK